MSDPHDFLFLVDLDSDAVQQILKRVAAQHDLRVEIAFEEGSKPTLIVNVNIGDKYIDKSSAPTSAKVLGPSGNAQSAGKIIQNLNIEGESADKLVEWFERLLTLTGGIQPVDPSALTNARHSIIDAMSAVQSPEHEKKCICTAWNTAEGWFRDTARGGHFPPEKANEVKALLEKIDGVLS